MTDSQLKKFLIEQHDEKDCGVACLKTIFRYYGSDISLEKLRRESGTTVKGTSLLGLYQGANRNGFIADGLEGNSEELKELNRPVILHLTLDGNFEHYVVCFSYKKGIFRIGDPDTGFKHYTPAELNKVWTSGYVLDLKPGENFTKTGFNKLNSLKWLKTHLTEDKSIFISAIFLGLILAFLSLTTAVFTEHLVDDILPKKDFTLLLKGLISWSILLIISGFMGYIREILMTRQGIQFNKRVIGYFLSKLLYLPKSFFDSKKQGDMVARLNDSEKIQSAVQYVLSQAIVDALLVIVSLGFLFYYNQETAFFAMAIIPLLILLLVIFIKPIKNQQHQAMHHHAINESNYIETINHIHTIKSHQKELFFNKKAQTTYSNFQNSVYSFQKLALRFNLSNDLLNTICLVLTITFGSFLYLENKIQLGELLASLSIIGILIQSVENLVLANVRIQGAKVALERMFEFTEEEKENKPQDPSSPINLNHLHFNNLTFGYPGQGDLLENISLSIHKGEITSILGENGCGKSTLIQIIQKFYSAYSGEIIVNDQNLKDIPTAAWRQIIGVVPQQIEVFNGSVLDNICMEDGDSCEKNIISFCEDWGFDQYFTKLHHGYHTLVGAEGINLSGGEKQLIALARALYRDPQLLILDEATAAMDRKTEQFVLNLIKRVKGQKTVLFITHRLHILKSFGGTIIVLKNCAIEATGNHDSLLKETNLYSKYWSDLLYA